MAGCASVLAGAVSAAKLTVSVGNCSSSFVSTGSVTSKAVVEQHQLAALEYQIGFSVLGDFGDYLQDDALYAFKCFGIGLFQCLPFCLNAVIEFVDFLLEFATLLVQRFRR